MKQILYFVASLVTAALPVSRAAGQTIDSAHVIRVHAGATAAEAYSRVAHILIESNYSITGAVPGLAMSGVANDAASVAILVSLDDDGSAYCAAELMTSGGAYSSTVPEHLAVAGQSLSNVVPVRERMRGRGLSGSLRHFR